MFTSDDYAKARHLAFISDQEAAITKKIVAQNYRGTGIIVDAGSFLGKSTVALASGLIIPLEGRKPVVAIDRFIATDRYIMDCFNKAGIEIAFGQSFLPLFLANIEGIHSLVEVLAGDVHQVGVMSSPIEILFLDIVKSIDINRFVILRWFSLLKKGATVIQQDFYSPAFPWIAVSMGALSEYFEIEYERVGESCVFKLRDAIPLSVISAVARLSPFTELGLKSIRTIRRRFLETFPSLLLHEAIILKNIGLVSESHEMFASAVSLSQGYNTSGKLGKWLYRVGRFIKHPQTDDFLFHDASLSDVI